MAMEVYVITMIECTISGAEEGSHSGGLISQHKKFSVVKN